MAAASVPGFAGFHQAICTTERQLPFRRGGSVLGLQMPFKPNWANI